MLSRSLYRAYRSASFLGYWVPRRFTPGGLLLLAAIILTAGISTDIEQMVAYQTLALLLGVLMVSVAFAPFFRGRFRVVRRLPRFASVGQPVHYTVELENRGGRPQSGLWVLEELADPRPTYEDYLEELHAHPPQHSFQLRSSKRRPRGVRVAPAPAPPLPAHGRGEARLQLIPQRRGVLRFAGITVARPDPFGIFRAFIQVPAPQQLMVLPKRYPIPAVALPGATKYQQGGVALAAAVGESEEFISLRNYRRGDPLRHIHWKSWARTGRPIVKEFQDEFFVRHALILDTFASPARAEAFEEAVSIAASFACTVLTQESLLDLMFVGPKAFQFTAGRGLAHADQMLEILAAVRLNREHSFATLETLVLEHLSLLSGAICVFLDWDPPRQELVRKLDLLGLPLLVFVVTDARDRSLLEPGPLRHHPESFHVIETGRAAEALSRLHSRLHS
jgi:uncharacterized protein (DUF58 family)